MLGSRGMVVLGAVVLAGIAFFVLMRGGGEGAGEIGPRPVAPAQGARLSGGGNAAQERLPSGPESEAPRDAPALDDIDAESRAKMRELLRELE